MKFIRHLVKTLLNILFFALLLIVSFFFHHNEKFLLVSLMSSYIVKFDFEVISYLSNFLIYEIRICDLLRQ